jgi:hypothetical protein
MSFIPPMNPPSQLDAAQAQERESQLDAKAAQYAHLHPGDGDRATSAGAIRRALRRVRNVIGRRS